MALSVWKLDATNNCINHGIIIFRIELTELMSFDFDYIRAVIFISGRRLIGDGAYSSKYDKLLMLVITLMLALCLCLCLRLW